VALVNCPKYHVCGAGALIDYIFDQMYKPNFMFVEEGILAAEYMLQIAKEYVEGVGGDSTITVMFEDGSVRVKPAWEISEEENLLKQFSVISNNLLLSALRTRVSEDADFERDATSSIEQLRLLRNKKKKSDKLLENLKQFIAGRAKRDQEEKEKAEAEAKRKQLGDGQANSEK
jgi:hypothetical protein